MRSLQKRKVISGDSIKSAQPLTHEHMKALYAHNKTTGIEGTRQFVSSCYIIYFEVLNH